MITPATVVRDVDAILALAGGLDDVAVHVDGGLFEELVRLSRPHGLPRFVDCSLKRFDLLGVFESTTEISRGGWIGDPLRTQRVEIGFVVAFQLKIFQTPPVTQRVVGDVEHVIGFVIGEMEMQQFDVSIDRLDQPALPSERMHQPDAAVTDCVCTIGEFELNVARPKHGLVAFLGFVFDPFLNASLAFGDLLSCNRHPTLPRLPLSLFTPSLIHSKSLRASGD